MWNRLYNGEMQCKNPAGLPPQARAVNPERMLPREAVPEQEWWLRGNDRTRLVADPPFTFYCNSPLKRNNFQAGAIEKDHSRRVFKELARQGHSFSETNVQALRQDRDIRKAMQKRYWEVMGAAPGPPGPTKSFLRSQSQPNIQQSSELASTLPNFKAAAAAADGAARSSVGAADMASMVSMASGAAASRVSAGPPGSRVSAGPPGSRVSASLPPVGGRGQGMGSEVAMSRVSAASDAIILAGGKEVPGGEPSALSVSDFYAWRPRLLR